MAYRLGSDFGQRVLLGLALTAILFLARLSRKDARRGRTLKNERRSQPEASIGTKFEGVPAPTILPIYPPVDYSFWSLQVVTNSWSLSPIRFIEVA